MAGRCLAAAEIYRRLGGSVSPFGALKGLTEARVRALEKRLKITLPSDLRALFLAAESAHFEWSLPAEQLASSGRLMVVTGGKLHWDPGILLEADALRRA